MKGNKLQDYAGFSTVITFAVSERSLLRLSVYDVTARLITIPWTVSRRRKAFFILRVYIEKLIFF
ncbi:MAG: hypothetical protein EA363_10930 [Balneolaceae bacterium]|nr:MAG: hypothetical protein EA363_10930 [Balneolaceae bacterium]